MSTSIGEVAQDRADRLITRRQALGRLGRLGLSVAAASSLLAACGDDGDGDDRQPRRARTTSTTSTSTATSTAPAEEVAAEAIELDGPRGKLLGAYATAEEPTANVLVIHENRGMTDHFPDVVGRLAQDGYAALVVDLLSPEGTPRSPKARRRPGCATAPVEDLVADLRAGIDELERRAPGPDGRRRRLLLRWRDDLEPPRRGRGPAGGGGAVLRAVPRRRRPRAATDAAVLGVYAGLDARVNAVAADAAVAALEAAGLEHEVRTFEGADHAFFNDTGPRYDAAGGRRGLRRAARLVRATSGLMTDLDDRGRPGRGRVRRHPAQAGRRPLRPLRRARPAARLAAGGRPARADRARRLVRAARRRGRASRSSTTRCSASTR